MNVVVLGAGAVGGWLGANLARAGHHVGMVGRPASVDAAMAGGLTIELPGGGGWNASPIRAATTLTGLAQFGLDYDALLLCVKAYDMDEAIRQIRAADSCRAGSPIACFQNGIGSEEKLVAAFGARQVVSATLTSPVVAPRPGAVRLERRRGGIGFADVASGSTGAMTLRELFGLTSIPVSIHSQYRAMKWSKMLLNIVANATSAILDLDPRQVYADWRTFGLEMAMLREAMAVMRAADIRLVNLPGAPAAWFGRLVRWLPEAVSKPIVAQFAARGRGDKRPSFYYDVLRAHPAADAPGRPGRCEVPYLNGAIAEAGRASGVPAPVNARLTRILMDLVERRQPAEAWRRQIDRLVSACGADGDR